MSKATTQSDDSPSDDYRIECTDVKGVGPATVEKLEKVGITTVKELHLCRGGRGGVTESRLHSRDLTIGKDTWEHLKAVGKAVHYSGSGRVEAKHLTGSITDGAEFSSSFVDITAQSPDTSDESKERELPDYSTQELQTALDCIHSEYPEGYGNQVSFEADVGRFLSESDTFDSEEHSLPTGIVQSVVRYRHDAEIVESQRDFEDHHKAILARLAETL